MCLVLDKYSLTLTFFVILTLIPLLFTSTTCFNRIFYNFCLTLIEEKSLYWNDDKEIVDTFVLKTIKRFEANNKANQELLPEYKDEEDREFARKLFRATILNADTYQRYMSEASRNWDFSRLAYMDVVIMQIAIAEMMSFPNIPISVTINEFVDLAKLYSTPKSGGYINGMLDAIARHLINSGTLLKPMPPRQQNKNEKR